MEAAKLERGGRMKTSKGKFTARIVALAASIAVGLGVWVGVAKPPALLGNLVGAVGFQSALDFFGAEPVHRAMESGEEIVGRRA